MTLEISYVTDLFYPYLKGGGERQFYEIARRMAKRHSVTVFTLRVAGSEKREFHEGMEIRRVGFYPRRRNFFLQAQSLLNVYPKYGIVHSNQGFSAFQGIFGGFVTIHDLYFGRWHEFFPFPSSYMGRFLEKMILLSRARFITVSRWSAEKLKAVGIDAEVIPNGIDTSLYKKGRKRRKIVYVGRLAKYKRVDELISAFHSFRKEHPEYELVIIGDGPERERLERMGGDGVRFLGFVDEKEKIRHLAEAEIFANPSEIEGFGISVLEAMASGCKIVLKPLPCYDYVDAIFTTDFRKGLETAVSSKKPKHDVSRFDWDNIVKKLEGLYLEATRR